MTLATTRLGRTGHAVSRLGFGAMELGGIAGELPASQVERLLHGVLDAGINLIDTAPDYQASEELIGRHLAGRRHEFFLASKCGCLVDRVPELRGGRLEHDFSPANVRAGVEQSLRRLRTDHLDLVQVHSSPSRAVLEAHDTVGTMRALQQEGKVRFLGMSSVLPDLRDHLAMGVFDVFQIPYSALQPEHEAVLTEAARAGAGTIVRGGVARGSPDLEPDRAPTQPFWRDFVRTRRDLWQRAGLDELAEGMGRTAFLLRFVLGHEDLHTTIVGTSKPEHLAANVAAARLGPLPAELCREVKRRVAAALAVLGMVLSLAVPLEAARAADAAEAWGPIQIAKETIGPGEKKKFTYLGGRTFEGGFVDFRIFVARGRRPGPALCVTSAIHGDEVNSIEIARRSFADVDPATLEGTLIVLPAINATGYRTLDRYMPDRRDLNRFFPGSRRGSVAAIVADEVFRGVVSHCSHLVDLHTGSNLRSNMPQIRVDPAVPEAMALARAFGVGVVIEGAGPAGSLRREACRAGIPAIIYEAGPPLVFLEPEIERGVEGVRNVMIHLGMIESQEKRGRSTRLSRSVWQRVPVDQGGIFLPVVSLGERVAPGQLLGTIADPVTDVIHRVLAQEAGVVIGMALPQIVLSGYGLFHIGEIAHD